MPVLAKYHNNNNNNNNDTIPVLPSLSGPIPVYEHRGTIIAACTIAIIVVGWVSSCLLMRYRHTGGLHAKRQSTFTDQGAAHESRPQLPPNNVSSTVHDSEHTLIQSQSSSVRNMDAEQSNPDPRHAATGTNNAARKARRVPPTQEAGEDIWLQDLYSSLEASEIVCSDTPIKQASSLPLKTVLLVPMNDVHHTHFKDEEAKHDEIFVVGDIDDNEDGAVEKSQARDSVPGPGVKGA